MEGNKKDPKEVVKKKCCGQKRQELTRRQFIEATAVVAGVAAAGSMLGPELVETVQGAGGKLAAPIITCNGGTQHTIFLHVCGGANGAPAGFSLQWVKHSDFPNLTCGASNQGAQWPSSSSPSNCNASLSGTPGCSIYNLGPSACLDIEIGNPDTVCGASFFNCGATELECGTEYVFRCFAHNVPQGLNKSDFTANLCCSTENCVLPSCVLTQGYWKTHACNWPAPFAPGTPDPTDSNLNGIPDNLEGQCAVGGPNSRCPCDATNTIFVGSNSYNQCELLCALARPGGGNALVILAHQLIAAKLNILNGATAPPNCDIAAADALIGSLNIVTGVVATGGPGNTLGPAMTAAAACLDLYNNGDGGVPHCA